MAVNSALCTAALHRHLLSFGSPQGFFYYFLYYDVFSAIMALLYIISCAIGIATGMLSKKQPALHIIPLSLMTVENFISLIQEIIIGTDAFRVIEVIAEESVGITALIFFLIAALVKNKAGSVFAILSASVFLILSICSFVGVFLNAGVFIMLSYIVIAIGIVVRNSRLLKQKR